MGKRIISEAVMLALLFSVLYVHYFLNIAIINYAVAALTAMALYEIYKPYGFTKNKILSIAGYALSMFIIFGNIENGRYTLAVMTSFVILLLAVTVVCHTRLTFKDASVMLMTTLYLSFGMSHLRLVLEGQRGFYLLFAVLIGALMTDVGGYFVGRFCGKHKLIEKISPKKTVEGAIGGILFALVSYVIYGLIIDYLFPAGTNWPVLMITGLIASVIAQFGDLTASMIKREIGIKDYGNLIPGHGGIMDRIDSILFVAPVIYYAHAFFGILI